MKRRVLVAMSAMYALAGCAASQPDIDKESVEDFIEVRQLESVDAIRTTSNDSWKDLNEYQIIYTARREEYLVVFSRRCWELNDTRVTPDQRWDSNSIRARFDTIRGCRIDSIYKLSETEAEELEQLGEAPGTRN